MNPYALVIDNDIRRYQAVAIRQGLKACKIGLRLNRDYTPTNCLRTAGRFTGETYSVRKGKPELERAIADITKVIDAYDARQPVNGLGSELDL